MNVDSLEALFVGNADFEEVEASQDVFCPFEAVGMVRQEIRHGHFLAYALDPQRPHGFGTECLRALMRTAAHAQRQADTNGQEGFLTPLDVHLMDFEKAQVRREWRSIDLVVVVGDEKLIVAIELKIDASEHSGQLRRYRKLVSEEWPVSAGWRHLFLFVTKHGDDASDADGEGWLTVPLEAVARELDGVAGKQIGSAEARTLLASYLAMLRRHHLPNEHLERLAAKLWSQHREALEFLMEHRPDADEGLYGMLYAARDDLAAVMSKASGMTVITDDSPPSNMRFAIQDWDQLPDFLTAQRWTSSNRLMLIEIQRSGDKRHIRIRLVIGPGEQEARLRYYQALADAGVQVSKRAKLSPQWTRVASRNLVSSLSEETEDVAGLFEKVVAKIGAYAGEILPSYDKALDALNGEGRAT